MNKARGCFITIVIIFFIGLMIVLCISIPNLSESTGGNILGSKNLLFLGVDEREGFKDFKGRTDTILILHMGSWGEKDTLGSIPRDTRVNLEGYGWNKINSAYVYGQE